MPPSLPLPAGDRCLWLGLSPAPPDDRTAWTLSPTISGTLVGAWVVWWRLAPSDERPEETVAEHHRALLAVAAASATVLPGNPGVQLPGGPARLGEYLLRHGPRLALLAERVAGRREYHLAWSWAEPVSPPSPLAAPASGLDYLRQRVRQTRAAATTAPREALAPLRRQIAAGGAGFVELPGRPGEVEVWAVLATTAEATAIGTLLDAPSPAGWSCRFTGPWPPYSFVRGTDGADFAVACAPVAS